MKYNVGWWERKQAQNWRTLPEPILGLFSLFLCLRVTSLRCSIQYGIRKEETLFSNTMKWPTRLWLIRHDTSAYNMLRDKKAHDSLYQEFLKAFDTNPESDTTQALARLVSQKFALGIGDAETPLADLEAKRAITVGQALRKECAALPDVIFVSPYHRAKATLAGLVKGFPELGEIQTYEEERVREQEHGLSLIYNDWRVFHALHPEQRKLRELEGPYWYRYPQGENVPDVRERNRSWLTTLTREFSTQSVFVVTHHLNILATRANLERLTAERFIELDERDKPINCGVTAYHGDSTASRNGRLHLAYYNRRYYS